MLYLFVFVFGILFNKIFSKFFLKRGFVDEVNHRSSHNSIATRSGGLVLYITLILYTIYLYFNGSQPFDFSIFIPISLLFITGLYDDIYNVDFELKFVFQILAAKILIDQGYIFNELYIMGIIDISFNRLLAQLFTILVFVTIFNAYNFIDGIDGNVHLESVKNLFIIYILSFEGFLFSKLIIFSIIILLINLYFNLRQKNKVFMGDSGSLLIAILMIIFSFELSTNKVQGVLNPIFLIIFLYPLIDITRIILVRLSNKKSPFIADTNHIHHLINSKFNNHLKSSLLIFIITLIIQLILIFLR